MVARLTMRPDLAFFVFYPARCEIGSCVDPVAPRPPPCEVSDASYGNHRYLSGCTRLRGGRPRRRLVHGGAEVSTAGDSGGNVDAAGLRGGPVGQPGDLRVDLVGRRRSAGAGRGMGRVRGVAR